MIQADPYAGLGPATVIRGDALHLPLPDASVDLICTSPPYWSLRSYQDGGAHYDGQLGSEATPDEFVTTLLAATREMIRVLRPSGSMWVNLGDKYDSGTNAARVNGGDRMGDGRLRQSWNTSKGGVERATVGRPKSLIGVPWRYALRCIDELGLILRAEVIWSKVNGLPESVTDRVRRSHEQWFHFTLSPRYFAAVDEIREPHAPKSLTHRGGGQAYGNDRNPDNHWGNPNGKAREINPLGKLPGSVREVPSAPLRVPAHLGVDHFAAFPSAWPAWIIRGWSPAGVCVECGQGRRPVVDASPMVVRPSPRRLAAQANGNAQRTSTSGTMLEPATRTITGYACACTPMREVEAEERVYDEYGDDYVWTKTTTRVYDFAGWTAPPTRPAVVLDPFGGTGTTAMAARALGRHGITLDLSADYSRLARWRVQDLDELATVQGHPRTGRTTDNQPTLLDLLGDPT